jgi:hypothetical protein
MNSDLPFSGNAGKAHWIASITRRGCGRVVHPWSAFSMVWIEVIIVSIVGPRQTDADAVRDPCNPNRRGWRRLVQLSDDINRAVSRAWAGARARIGQPYPAVIKFFGCAFRASQHSRPTLCGRFDRGQGHKRRGEESRQASQHALLCCRVSGAGCPWSEPSPPASGFYRPLKRRVIPKNSAGP